MTILAMVNAEKEGQIESKMQKARQMEEIREAKRREQEARQEQKKSKLVRRDLSLFLIHIPLDSREHPHLDHPLLRIVLTSKQEEAKESLKKKRKRKSDSDLPNRKDKESKQNGAETNGSTSKKGKRKSVSFA